MNNSDKEQILKDHSELNQIFYRDYLWGSKKIEKQPSPSDVQDLIGFFSPYGKLQAAYAHRILVVYLNQ